MTQMPIIRGSLFASNHLRVDDHGTERTACLSQRKPDQYPVQLHANPPPAPRRIFVELAGFDSTKHYQPSPLQFDQAAYGHRQLFVNRLAIWLGRRVEMADVAKEFCRANPPCVHCEADRLGIVEPSGSIGREPYLPKTRPVPVVSEPTCAGPTRAFVATDRRTHPYQSTARNPAPPKSQSQLLR